MAKNSSTSAPRQIFFSLGASTSLCSACHADWLASYDWHAYCTGCQTCHGHGQDWQNADWGGGVDEATSCFTEAAPAGLEAGAPATTAEMLESLGLPHLGPGSGQ